MSSIPEQFLEALKTNTPEGYAEVLTEDAAIRIAGWRGSEGYRPRSRVVKRLMDEWSAWPDPVLEVFSVVGAETTEGKGPAKMAVDFRIQATENNRYVEHNRAAILTVRDGKIAVVDLYCPEPLPSARRKGWIAPATLTDAELDRLFESYIYTWDNREWIPPMMRGFSSLRFGRWYSDSTHPGSNGVGGVRWTAEEADARIEEMIDFFRQRNAGFTWYVGPYDTPSDLRERLERHGVLLAGDQAMMALKGLNNLDIPVNPDLEIQEITGPDPEAVEAILSIIATCFHWTQEQVDEHRPGMLERLANPEFRKKEKSYLARLDGKPVADAHLNFRGGTAYLGGASTLPEYRNRRIYSTLLRRRLEDARKEGYHIAAIHAEPMSRRVVSRYGFKEYARYYVYAWMPVIDMDVIKSLVPDD